MVIGLFAFLAAELVMRMLPGIPAIITISTLGILLAQTPFISILKGGPT